MWLLLLLHLQLALHAHPLLSGKQQQIIARNSAGKAAPEATVADHVLCACDPLQMRAIAAFVVLATVLAVASASGRHVFFSRRNVPDGTDLASPCSSSDSALDLTHSTLVFRMLH